MAKKSGGRSAGKAQRRHLRQAEARPAAPLLPPATGEAAGADYAAPRSAVPAPRSAVPSRAAAPVPRRGGSPLPAGQTDYGYVRQDLRRIGVLTGTVVAVLAVLTFFLR